MTLTNCIFEPDPGEISTAATMSSRAIAITEGRLTMEQTTVSGHFAGALSVYEAALVLAECTIWGNRASSGGAILVGAGAFVVILRSNFTDNSADVSGGALQVTLMPKQLRIRLALLQH